MGALNRSDKRSPKVRGNLVRGVAAKALDSHRRVMQRKLAPVAPQSVAINAVVDLEQVAPGHYTIVVPRSGMHRLAICAAPVPGGMLRHQLRVECGVVDY